MLLFERLGAKVPQKMTPRLASALLASSFSNARNSKHRPPATDICPVSVSVDTQDVKWPRLFPPREEAHRESIPVPADADTWRQTGMFNLRAICTSTANKRRRLVLGLKAEFQLHCLLETGPSARRVSYQ